MNHFMIVDGHLAFGRYDVEFLQLWDISSDMHLCASLSASTLPGAVLSQAA